MNNSYGRSHISRKVVLWACALAELMVLCVSVAEKTATFLTVSVILLVGTGYLALLWSSKERHVKQLLVVPAVLVLASVSLIPFVYAIRASLSNVSPINLLGTWKFVGMRNYVALFRDPVFVDALILTVEYLIVTVAIEFLLGFGFALLLDKLPNFILSIFIVPMIVTPVVAGLIWKSMLNLDTGFVNLLLKSFGLPGVPWLTYQNLPFFGIFPASVQELASRLHLTYGFFAIVSVDIWQWTPFMSLFLLTGLRSLPTELFECSKIDGADSWQTFRFVTLPMLRSVIVVAVLIRMIDVFKAYDTIYAMFGSAVGVRTLNVDLITYVFMTYDYGIGSALAIFVLILISIIVPVFYNLMNRATER